MKKKEECVIELILEQRTVPKKFTVETNISGKVNSSGSPQECYYHHETAGLIRSVFEGLQALPCQVQAHLNIGRESVEIQGKIQLWGERYLKFVQHRIEQIEKLAKKFSELNGNGGFGIYINHKLRL